MPAVHMALRVAVIRKAAVGDKFGNGDYKKGDSFDVDGNFVLNLNDKHGTHVSGTGGANRDGIRTMVRSKIMIISTQCGKR